MGWTTGYNSRKELVAEVTRSYENDLQTMQVIRKFFSGNNLWCVFERRSKAVNPDKPCTCDVEFRDMCKGHCDVQRFIVVFLIRCWKTQGGGMDWGYKDVSEEMGPCEISCPVSYLDMVPDPGGFATNWRKRVRMAHAAKNQKLVPGQTVRLSNDRDYFITKIIKRNVYGVDQTNGCEYRIPRGMLVLNA